MSKNAHALRTIRSVGSTPGFAMDPQDRGRYKLIRPAIEKYGVKEASITVSANSADRQYQNDLGRLKNKLGWTPELFTQMEEITRLHRIAETDPADDHLKALLTALGVDPNADPEAEAQERRTQRRRHAGGGSATGSARVHAGEAQPAGPSTEAPVQLLTNVGKMQAEMISPERAIDLLTRLAPYQRKLDDKKVRSYAAAMKRGEWKLNPADPLCIDTNNMTANGQHRLHACVEAEVPFQCWVAYDTPPDTYDVMDRGKRRTTADMLHGAGEVNTNFLAAVARFAHLWFNVEQDQWKSAPDVTEAQVFAILEAHPRLRESVRHGRLTKLKTSRQATMLAHYLIARKMGGDDRLVTRWYQAIQDMDLERGNPGHTLGLYYLQGADRRRKVLSTRPKRDLDMYLLLKAWNNTCLGKEVRNVSWDSNFEIPQPIEPKYDPSTGQPLHTFPPIG